MRKQAYKYILAILDLVGIIVSFLAAIKLHGSWKRTLVVSEFPFIGQDIFFLFIFSVFILLIFQYQNLYKINVFLSIAEQIARLAFSIIISIIGFSVIAFFLKSNAITESRLVLFYYFVLALIFLSIGRILLFRGVFLLLTWKRIYAEPALIVGSGKTARILAANISLDSRYALSLAGFADNDVQCGTVIFQKKKVLGTLMNIQQLVTEYSIREILICTENVTHEQLLKTLDICQHTKARVKIASPLYGIISEKMVTEKYGDVFVVEAGHTEEKLTLIILKRMFDLILALFGLLLILPLLIIIAIAIRIESPGPAIYSQIRIGKNGKPFKFYKFRSMIHGSDKDMRRAEKAIQFIKNTHKK